MRRTLLLGLVAAVCALLIATPRLLAGGEPLETKGISAYFSPDGGAEQALTREIRTAKKSLDVALYMLTSTELCDTLIQRAQSGVEVRLILDDNQAKNSFSKTRALAGTKVQLRRYVPDGGSADDERGEEPKMHHKFCVIDEQVVITGSFNWTKGAETKNCENVLILRDKRAAAAFRKEFDRLWELAAEEK